MKVCFLVPPVVIGDLPAERSSGCTHVVYPTPNIYELQVAACVREAKHQIQYLDCVNGKIAISDFLDSQKQNPSDVYAIWTVNLSIENDVEVVKQLRRVVPNSFVVFLGPGANYYTDIAHVDDRTIVVHGEPEMTLIDLLDALQNNADLSEINGLSYVKNGQTIRTPMRALMKDLDSLPFPARDLVASVEYRNPKLKLTPYTTMVTSRNCPFHCIYCVPSSLTFAREIEYKHYFGKKPPISFRSVEKVREEIAYLHSCGVRAIGFMDDNFIWNEKRTKAICDALKEYEIVWGCQARVDAITEPIAKMLGESGCRYVDLGVESFYEKILEYVHKGITRQQIYAAIHWLQKYGVPVKLNILIGTSPLETKETIKETIREARKLDVDQLMINIVSPFPETELYDLAIENGWIKGGKYVPTDVQRNSILNYPHLSAKEMEHLLFVSNLKYFLSPRFVWKQIWRFRSWKDFTHALRTLKIKLFG